MPFQLVILIALASDVTVQAPPPKPLNVRVWDDFYHARSNMRYHLMESGHYQSLDILCRVAVLVLSLVAIVGPKFQGKAKWQKWWYLVGAIAFLFAASPLVWPYGDWSREHGEFSTRWSALADKWHALYDESLTGTEGQLRDRLDALKMEERAIEKGEPSGRYKDYVMREAERAENNFQGVSGEANTGWWWILDFLVPPFGIRSLYVFCFLVLVGLAAIIARGTWLRNDSVPAA